MLKRIGLLIFALFPSALKIVLLNRKGHAIHPSCHLGMSYFDIQKMILGPHTRIASFNYFKGLRLLEMKEAARIGGKFNWFTASNLHESDSPGFGELRIDANSNITSHHFFDIQRTISIGKNTLIAGFHSYFWTHGYGAHGHIRNGIHIGDNCYLGSHSNFMPGSSIGDRVIVGACSVVTKDFSNESCCLLAGNPASVRKTYSGSEYYFQNEHGGFLPGKVS